MYVCTSLYTCAHVCICVCTHVHTCALVCICVCIIVQVCARVCTRVHRRACTRVHKRAEVCTYVHTHVWVRVLVCVRVGVGLSFSLDAAFGASVRGWVDVGGCEWAWVRVLVVVGTFNTFVCTSVHTCGRRCIHMLVWVAVGTFKYICVHKCTHKCTSVFTHVWVRT